MVAGVLLNCRCASWDLGDLSSKKEGANECAVRLMCKVFGIFMKQQRDIEKHYSTAEFVAKLRRLADALEAGDKFEIQVANERIYVPVRAKCTIEHERSDSEEEIEFQIKWSHE